MVVEHAHGLRQRRGPNAKSSLHKAHLAPDAGLQAAGASLSFAQGSHDFESLARGIGRGDRFETENRLDQELELFVIGLGHVIDILNLNRKSVVYGMCGYVRLELGGRLYIKKKKYSQNI